MRSDDSARVEAFDSGELRTASMGQRGQGRAVDGESQDQDCGNGQRQLVHSHQGFKGFSGPRFSGSCPLSFELLREPS